jgi:hypothetical protein
MMHLKLWGYSGGSARQNGVVAKGAAFHKLPVFSTRKNEIVSLEDARIAVDVSRKFKNVTDRIIYCASLNVNYVTADKYLRFAETMEKMLAEENTSDNYS